MSRHGNGSMAPLSAQVSAPVSAVSVLAPTHQGGRCKAIPAKDLRARASAGPVGAVRRFGPQGRSRAGLRAKGERPPTFRRSLTRRSGAGPAMGGRSPFARAALAALSVRRLSTMNDESQSARGVAYLAKGRLSAAHQAEHESIQDVRYVQGLVGVLAVKGAWPQSAPRPIRCEQGLRRQAVNVDIFGLALGPVKTRRFAPPPRCGAAGLDGALRRATDGCC